MNALYSTPAGIDDFAGSRHEADRLKMAWDDKIRKMIADEAGYLYYGVLEDLSGVPDGDSVLVPWDAFPRSLSVWFDGIEADDPEGRAERAAATLRSRRYWKRAGSTYQPITIQYRQQDEYCEWHSWEDEGGLVRLAYTSENPEYWTTIAEIDPKLLVDLYEKLLDTKGIQPADLFWQDDIYLPKQDGSGYDLVYKKDDYNPYNVWNTERGVVHLTHPSNSLGAEVHLAAQGAWRYPGDDALDARGLLCCGGHGRIERSSDPTIASRVSGLAQKGLSVALADPVGLYIQPPRFVLKAPDGRDVFQDCVKVVRGDPGRGMVLRLEVKVPDGAGYTLPQLRLPDNAPLTGSRMARFLGMGLFAHAKMIPGAKARVIEACTNFCCTAPTVPGYRAVFGRDDYPQARCDQLPPGVWQVQQPTEPRQPGQVALTAEATPPPAVRFPSRSVF